MQTKIILQKLFLWEKDLLINVYEKQGLQHFRMIILPTSISKWNRTKLDQKKRKQGEIEAKYANRDQKHRMSGLKTDR